MIALKTKGSGPEKVLCNLVWDEMDIRQELTFRNDEYYDYIDMGFGNVCNSDAQTEGIYIVEE